MGLGLPPSVNVQVKMTLAGGQCGTPGNSHGVYGRIGSRLEICTHGQRQR